MKRLVTACMLFGALSLSGCQTAKMAENAVDLDVRFTWKNTKACTGVSPAFTIANLPKETVYVTFYMVDQQAPGYPHGGGKVKVDGSNVIPQGAFGYSGPCPPVPHNYKWTVTAYNATEDLILGEGTVSRIFPEQ